MLVAGVLAEEAEGVLVVRNMDLLALQMFRL
jgi:hypothetical protein